MILLGDSSSHSYSMQGPKRIDRVELPVAALREVLINAFAHRNYMVPSPIKIAFLQIELRFLARGILQVR